MVAVTTTWSVEPTSALPARRSRRSRPRSPSNVRAARIAVLPLIAERRRRRPIPAPIRSRQRGALTADPDTPGPDELAGGPAITPVEDDAADAEPDAVAAGHDHVDRRAHIRAPQYVRRRRRPRDRRTVRATRITALPLVTERRRRRPAPRPIGGDQRAALERRPRHSRHRRIRRCSSDHHRCPAMIGTTGRP